MKKGRAGSGVPAAHARPVTRKKRESRTGTSNCGIPRVAATTATRVASATAATTPRTSQRLAGAPIAAIQPGRPPRRDRKGKKVQGAPPRERASRLRPGHPASRSAHRHLLSPAPAERPMQSPRSPLFVFMAAFITFMLAFGVMLVLLKPAIDKKREEASRAGAAAPVVASV